MYQELRETIGVSYERFLMRDLTYVFSGFILLLCITFAYNENINIIFNLLINESNDCNWCIFLIFLAIAYFVGFIAKEGLQHIKKKKNKDGKRKPWLFNTLPDYPKPFNEHPISEGKGSLILQSIIGKRYGFGTLRELERRVYIFHIGASVGTASFLGFIILLISTFFNNINLLESIVNLEIYSQLIFVLIISSVVCRIENSWMLKEYETQLKRLAIDILLLKEKKWINENAPTLNSIEKEDKNKFITEIEESMTEYITLINKIINLLHSFFNLVKSNLRKLKNK